MCDDQESIALLSAACEALKVELFFDVQSGRGLEAVRSSVHKFALNLEQEIQVEAEAWAQGQQPTRRRSDAHFLIPLARLTDTVDSKLKGEYAVAVLTQRTFMAQRIQRILRFSTRCIRALHVASENLVDQLDSTQYVRITSTYDDGGLNHSYVSKFMWTCRW